MMVCFFLLTKLPRELWVDKWSLIRLPNVIEIGGTSVFLRTPTHSRATPFTEKRHWFATSRTTFNHKIDRRTILSLIDSIDFIYSVYSPSFANCA